MNGWSVNIRNCVLVYGMGCYYTGLNVSNQDGVLMYCTRWGVKEPDGVLVYAMECSYRT